MAAHFAAAGLALSVTDHGDHLRIEAEVPDSLSVESWLELLHALEEADMFGDLNTRGRSIVWAAINKTPCYSRWCAGARPSASGS